LKTDFSNWEKVFRIHAGLAIHQKRIAKSKVIIEKFLSQCRKPYIAWSTGKDSTALLHLVLSIDSGIRVMTHHDDTDFPEDIEYIKAVSDMLKIIPDVVSPAFSVLGKIKCDKIDITSDVHSKKNLAGEQFFDVIEKYRIANEFDGCFLGLRSEESKGRKANRRYNGVIYSKSNGDRICQPIVDWVGADVFAYLLSNNIPIHPIYRKLKFHKTPCDIRKDSILPSNFDKNAVWLKYYYPEIYQKLSVLSGRNF